MLPTSYTKSNTTYEYFAALNDGIILWKYIE